MGGEGGKEFVFSFFLCCIGFLEERKEGNLYKRGSEITKLENT